MDKGEKRFNQKFWKKVNKICLTCRNDCKQSSFVEIVECPHFKKLPNNEIHEVMKNLQRSKFGHYFSCKSGKMDKLLLEGKTHKQICMFLHISESRLKSHINHLRKEHGYNL